MDAVLETYNLPSSRAAAAAAGIRRYFTGIPCINGHIDIRTTKSGKCMSCVRKLKMLSKKTPAGRARERRYLQRSANKIRIRERARRNNMTQEQRAKRMQRDRESRKTPKAMAQRREYLSRPEVRSRALELRRARYKEKYLADPGMRINARIAALMRRHIKNGKQGRSWALLVDFNLAELMVHLERQFTSGMDWAALLRGEIHIDHIIPIKAFRISEYGDAEFRACWNLGNLRPMWALDNNKKRARMEFLV